MPPIQPRFTIHSYWLLGLLLQFSTAHAQDMTWAVHPLPGLAMVDEGNSEYGFAFDMQRVLEAQLPELRHHHLVSTIKRMEQELAQGKTMCSMLVLRHPDRDKVGYYVDYAPHFPMELVSRQGSLPDSVMVNGKASLARLLKTPLYGGVSSIRGYPLELQSLIQRGIETGKITTVYAASKGVNLVAMVSYQRLDYTVDFPIVTEHLSKINPLPLPLSSTPLLENQNLVPAGIYCPRTAWGRQMVRRINAAIQHLASSPDTLLTLYNDNRRAKYEAQLRAYFEKRKTAAVSY